MSKQCTKCKKTFDDSVMVCPDCKMGLITIAGAPEPAKEEEPAPAENVNKTISLFSVTSEESAERVVEYLNAQGIPSSYNMNLRERNYKINVAPEKSKEALKAYTAFYAIEAKRLKAEEDKRRAEEEAKKRAEEEARRKAEEEARRKAEAEERRKQEEEEKRRRLEEERKRIQAEEIKRAEAEAERVKNEAQRAREEAEAKVREAEEYKKRIQEEAKLKAEQAKAAAQAKIDALKAQAEEARLRAEEAKRAAEEELKARAEEERRRAAEEALRRKEEEERRKKEESEQRVNRFTDLFKQSDSEKKPARTSKGFSFDELGQTDDSRFGYIPRVDGEAVSSDFNIPETNNFFDDIEPEEGPIFVETEPVEEYNIGDTIVVDAVEVEPGSEEDNEEAKSFESGDEYSSFFSSIKQEKFNSIFGNQKEEPTEEQEEEDSGIPFFSENESAASSGESTFSSSIPAPEDIVVPPVEEKRPESIFDSFIRKEPEFSLDDDSRYTTEPIVEDIFADNPFSSKDSTKTTASDNKVFEEVINKDLKKSGADKFKAAFDSGKSKFGDTDNLDDIDNGMYRGFVPDYHEDTTDDEDTRIAQSMGFDPEAYKKLKAKTEKRAMERKNNPKANKPKKEKNPDFVVVDEEEEVKLDYTGFVPDYSNKKDDMSFYTSRTEIDYSKYRKGGAQGSSDDSSNSLASLTGTLRSTNSYELNKLFSAEAVKGSAQPKDFTALKSTNFVLALTGGQLNSLFTSWLITNCTKTTAKQFEKATATNEENYDLKIEGIKSLLRSNFGKLDEYALDIIVKRFYNKYIDE